MTQIILNIEDKSLVPHLKKLFSSLNGVTFTTTKKSGIDEALDDIKEGRIYKAESVDDMFNSILER